jgi:hypothetical protein
MRIVSIDFVDLKYIGIDTKIVSLFFFIQYLASIWQQWQNKWRPTCTPTMYTLGFNS